MRLKCIKLAGFKSFVDATTVYFPSNICAVVGPNGCGKSNIIDAVRWVMGESSAKNLRGESMTDVIFNGSKNRKPVEQASVELVFDNSDHTLVGEYASYTDISVKRRVSRESKNTYFLNGTKCRRRDIMDIFLGTGLGPRSYAIISQGMISNLIESKPEDLRVFIEEAAGISKYKERRKETEQRIRRTYENLDRLADVRQELQNTLERLQRQAKIAEKYQNLREEERTKKAQLLGLKWREADLGVSRYQEAIDNFALQVEEQNVGKYSYESFIEEKRLEHQQSVDDFNKRQSEFYRLGNEITKIEQEITFQQQRLKELNENLEETKQAGQEARALLATDQKKLATICTELEVIEPELEILKDSKEEASCRLVQMEIQQEAWQQKWDQFNQSASASQRQADVQQAKIEQTEKSLERTLVRKQRLQEEKLQIEVQKQNTLIDQLHEQSMEYSLGQESIQENLQSALEKVQQQRLALEQTIDKIKPLRQILSSQLGRCASLEALQQAALEEKSQALFDWLSQRGVEHKRLIDELRIDEGWEKALDVVLGQSLNSVCLDNLNTQAGLLAAQGFSVNAFDGQSQADERCGSLGRTLLDLVTSSWDLTDPLAYIYAVEDLDEALELRAQLKPYESVVTKDGFWLSSSWLRVEKEEDEQAGLFARHQQLAELKIEISELENKISTLEAEQQQQQRLIQQAESQREELQPQLVDWNSKLARVQAQISAEQLKDEQIAARARQLDEEIEELEEQFTLEKETLAESRMQLEQALDIMGDNQQQRETLLAERELTREQTEQHKHSLQSLQQQVHQLALQQQALSTQKHSIEHGVQRLSEQIAQFVERLQGIRQQLDQGCTPEDQLQERLEQLLHSHLQEEQKLKASEQKKLQLESLMQEKERLKTDCEQSLQNLRNQLETERLNLQKEQLLRQTAEQQLSEVQYDLVTVLETLPQDLNQKDCELQIEKLGSSIDRLGAINLAAIDEYQKQQKRKEYLDSQNEDLLCALETLKDAIMRIDKATKSHFKETFDRINGGLQELFPKVFGGGNASLQLTGEDLLQAGVTIMAQPPGKKNSTIHLLSGGEKALTAIALVFAIFQLNPAPFCLLDEVDAPLDDANVGRYARLVADMSDKVQFIYITHNKIAMESSKQLIGITMHEPGVSRPVCVDVEDAVKLANA